MLRCIEAFDLLFLAYPQTCCVFADHEDGEGDGRAPYDHATEAQQLFERAVAFGQRIYAGGGEDAGQDRAGETADAMDAEGVEAVVVLEQVLDVVEAK